MNRLNGKTAIVTGAGAGIGAATARALAAEGAAVVVADLDLAAAERTVQAIGAAGGRSVAVQHNVADEAGWQRVFETATGRFGGVHVVVNNAGIAPTGDSIETLSLADWRRTLAVNLDGVFLGTREAIRAMKGNGAAGGSIVNVSSILGIVATPNAPDYVAAKGAVRLLTKAAALECGAAHYPIRVNSVHPGYIETPMLANGLRDMVGKGVLPNEQIGIDALTGLHPIGRLGKPTDIAAAIVYLASDESGFMTGAELVVDGGYTAR